MTDLTTNDHALDSFFDNAQPTQPLRPEHVTASNDIISPISTKVESQIEDGIESIKLEVTADTDTDVDSDTDTDNAFELLGLAPVLLKSIAATGYTTPTPIQAQAIPAAMNGRDLLLSAQTGSGKTAAFVLPILHNLDQDTQTGKKNNTPKVKALILTPTRELAHQVGDSIRKYGSSMRGLFSVPLVGGAAYSGQIRALKKGVQIIVATPGRLLDHINAGRVDLSQLEMLVLDEADRMLDMGFADDIEAILKATPANRQTIMSSATWDGPVGKIAESFTDNPERISIKVETAHIDESVYFCDNFDHKNKLMEQLLCDPERGQAIVFTATKRSSEELAERLQEWGHKACYLHGDLPQSKRNRIVADLRSGKYDIVVATDVAARGLDLPNITHVFNYDLPRQVEDYVHRIGRSGRAGRTGIAINLCSRDDRRQFGNIMRYLKRDIQESTVEGLEPRFVEKFDGRGRDGQNRGRGRSGERGGNRFGGRSDSRSGNRFDSRSDNRGDKPRFSRDDRPQRGRDERDGNRDNRSSDSRHDNRFERSASSNDRFKADKPRFGDNQRFDDKPFAKKPFAKQGDSSRERFGDDKPRRTRGVNEQTFSKDSFNDKPRFDRRSEKQGDKPFEGKKSFDKPKRFNSDKPRLAKDSQGGSRGNSGNDGWDAPKRSRRDSTGKPL